MYCPCGWQVAAAAHEALRQAMRDAREAEHQELVAALRRAGIVLAAVHLACGGGNGGESGSVRNEWLLDERARCTPGGCRSPHHECRQSIPPPSLTSLRTG
jgi:hypothetical protein